MGAVIAIPVSVMLLGILYLVNSYNAVNTGASAVAGNTQSYAAVSASGASNTEAVVPNAISLSGVEMAPTK